MKEILSKTDKKLIEGLITMLESLKTRVIYIKKNINSDLVLALRKFNDNDTKLFSFPIPSHMCKNMKINKEYALKELGLFEDE